MTVVYPDPFLEVRLKCAPPPSLALCAGYDGGHWRCGPFSDHLFNWLPYAALAQEHQLAFNSSNFVEFLRVAAAHIYHTKKTNSRGEIGELILHLSCIHYFQTIPVMCKLVLKTSSNDTVKGFDGVHLLLVDDTFEIWLGESKFYTNGGSAIRDAVKSIRQHILPAFLATEKAMIFGHVAENIPHRDEVTKLFKQQTSGDELLKRAVFPVLIAYQSAAVASSQLADHDMITELKSEIDSLRDAFGSELTDVKLRFELIFVPLGSKKDLVSSFDAKLRPFL